MSKLPWLPSTALVAGVVLIPVVFPVVATFGQNPPNPPPPEPPAASSPAKSLRFNFQHQPWDEVLQWLADQADLSLVLDAPPPGSFNYTDGKSYTAREAIDLVNGVLAGKGYTLLRRERMLMLVNLQDEVSRGLAPRIDLDEVDQHGANEFVTVAFPLGKRDATAALEEIRPLISQYGKASALPASGQLLVTDRAAVMRPIAELVESIPAPAVSSAAPSKAVEREFRVYALEGADPAAAIELLQAVVDGKFVHDPSGERINAYAAPTEHAIIEQLMQQVRGATGAHEFRLEVYPIEGLSAVRQAQIVADLQLGATEVPLRFDAENQQLVVWANAQRHVEIRKALLTLLASGEGTRKDDARVYPLQHIEAARLAPLLQGAVPEARFSQAGSDDRILAIAAPRDQRLIEQLVTQLDLPDKRETLTIKEYRLQSDPPPELAQFLASAAPRAKIRIDAPRRSVVATGEIEDQRLVAEALQTAEQNLQTLPEQDLAIYVLSKLQQERFDNVRTSIEQEAPTARLVHNAASGELFVWAAPEDHRAIEGLLDSLDQAPRREPTRQFRAYGAAPSQLDALAAMIAQAAPKALTTVDRPGRRLLVWAEAEDHAQLAPLLAPAESAPPFSAEPFRYEAYPVGNIDLTLAVQLLTEVFPDAEFKPDATARSIVAHASAAEHREIDAMLRQLRDGSKAQSDYEVKVYPLGGLLSTQVDSIRPLFPSMIISVDQATSQIISWGTRDGHLQLRAALDSLGGGGKPSDAWQVYLFPLEKARAAEVALGLAQLAPAVTATAVNDGQLLVRCRSELKPQIAELISQLDAHPTQRMRQEAKSFALRTADPNTLIATLQSLFPIAGGSHFSYDLQTRSLMAIVDPEQMERVQEVIEVADRRGEPEQGARELRVHPLAGVPGTMAVATLEELFKERGTRPLLSIDAQRNRIVAVATPAEQQLVVDVLESLAPQETDVAVFSLRTMEPSAAELAIAQLFDGTSSSDGSSVQIESDDDGGRILVRATPAQLDEIRALLQKLGEVDLDAPLHEGEGLLPSDSNNPTRLAASSTTGDFGIYPLKNASADRVASVLTKIYSQSVYGTKRIHFAADERINAVVAMGGRSERREVEALLQSLDSAQTTDFFKPDKPVVLTLEHASAPQIYDQLRNLYRIELDRGARQPPIEIPPGAEPELVATLQQINASREGPLLSLEVDADSNSLLVIAPRPLLEEIRQFVAQLDRQSTKSRVGVRVVPLEALKGEDLLRSLDRIMLERKN